ncbi:MAG: bifunctional adenosylcobinamide kinase/adenosylcobinamide-phosphate guanylyltransferase [Coriobacteriia bacterium]|nr:bifunctional adenosylcobinamide kinase/adenosylcobinamide-phosphate guanylyltransferase [Coriobacteriia bacterium]
MILIIGGAHQGKLEYALSTGQGLSVYQCSLDDIDVDYSCDIINSAHSLILALMRSGISPEAYFADHIADLTGKIIVIDDITSGVVPIDAEMRLWRDNTGRAMGFLSKHADRVVRVFCGIATTLKPQA